MEKHDTPDRQSEDQQAVINAAIELFEQLSEDDMNIVLAQIHEMLSQ